jgi:SAM domain (Sterile alpha motif)
MCFACSGVAYCSYEASSTNRIQHATRPRQVLVSFCGCRLNGTGRPMQQIADWLKQLGLSEYAQRFAANDIDLSVLPHLTDQDLKDVFRHGIWMPIWGPDPTPIDTA